MASSTEAVSGSSWTSEASAASWMTAGAPCPSRRRRKRRRTSGVVEGIEIRSGRARGTVGHGVWEQIRSGFGFRLGKEGNFGAHFLEGDGRSRGMKGAVFLIILVAKFGARFLEETQKIIISFKINFKNKHTCI